jgi:cytochrome P450
MYNTRICTRPTTAGDVHLDAGQKVLVGLASANRDDTVFPAAREFRLDRTEQPQHLAFGWGAHLCLGAPVARQVGLTTLNTFLDLVDAIDLEPGAVPVPYLSVQGNGLDELRVRLRPREASRRDSKPVAGTRLEPSQRQSMS